MSAAQEYKQLVQQVQDRLEDFIEYIFGEFENKLQAYHMILEGDSKKAGKFADSFSGIVGSGVGAGVGGSLGAGIGLPLGSPVSGAKVGARLGTKAAKEAGKFIGGTIGEKHHKNKIINLLNLVERFRKDKSHFRKVLVEAGFDVFQSFEMQFMRVTTEQGPKKQLVSIHKKINLNDKGLEETRIKEIIGEVKNEILEALRKQSLNSEEDRKILLSLESSLKSLNIDEYFEMFKLNFEEVKQGQQKIEESLKKNIEENFDQLNKKQDNYHDQDMGEHSKTRKEINELPEKIVQLAVKMKIDNEGPITFDVKDPVRSFIGRKQELIDLHSKMQRGSERVTVISQMTYITGLH